MNPQPEVINILADHISKYPHVEKVVLFGSRARGDERERSDIDIAVIGPEITDAEWTDIWTYVDEEAPALLCVDVVNWKEASETLRKSIERDGVILYERHQAAGVYDGLRPGSGRVGGSGNRHANQLLTKAFAE